MKHVIWLAFLLAPICSGAPCVSSSLATYISLGSTGCTVSNNTFSDFVIRSPIAGATAVAPSSVTINPTGGTSDPGLDTSVVATASAGNLLQVFFSYRISGSSYTNAAIGLFNSTSTGDGGVTGITDFCAGGTFGPGGVSGCTGTAGNLVTLAGLQNTDSRNFGAVSFLTITDDFTLDGGIRGTATGGRLSNRFSAVPEPVTYLLAAAGLFFFAGLQALRAIFSH